LRVSSEAENGEPQPQNKRGKIKINFILLFWRSKNIMSKSKRLLAFILMLSMLVGLMLPLSLMPATAAEIPELPKGENLIHNYKFDIGYDGSEYANVAQGWLITWGDWSRQSSVVATGEYALRIVTSPYGGGGLAQECGETLNNQYNPNLTLKADTE